MVSSLKFVRVCPFVALIFCLLFLFEAEPGRVSGSVRSNYLRRARVWHPVNIRNADMLAGPKSEIAVPPEDEVWCRYIEERLSSGYTPKFKCQLLESGESVRIKFSSRETSAEIAGTRLLWALGFYTDESYPVKIRCFQCPEKNPYRPSRQEKRIQRLIGDVTMERNFDGIEFEQYDQQGWSWPELDEVEEQLGGASKAQIEALKLLAVFLQHTDSKRQQQRLACYSEDISWQENSIRCKKPVLMIQDLGATFGAGDRKVTAASAMYFKGWQRTAIWNLEKEERFAREHKGERACFGRLTSAGHDGLFDPQISEEGRQFLAHLLNQLSDKQIGDLFRGARADQTGEIVREDGRNTSVTIQHWVAAFKQKREQINNHRCS